jgi:hypothetical protein
VCVLGLEMLTCKQWGSLRVTRPLTTEMDQRRHLREILDQAIQEKGRDL